MTIDERFVEALLPTLDTCRFEAASLRAMHPNEAVPELVGRATRAAQRWAALAGAGAGLLSNPFVMVPAALADMTLLIRAEAHLAGVVTALADPAVLDQGPEVLTADILA